MNGSRVSNRPGLSALKYRASTYGTFMQTMTERLTALLPALTTRDPDDASMALLDGWAVIGDVLTFYEERIANEGFLRTATEKRSMLEFAKLVGYRPRPGVAAGVPLAYTLEKGGDVTLSLGNKAQSVPGPGQTPQTYETSDALDARADWNALGIRSTMPQAPKTDAPFYLSTITTNLKPNDLLLFVQKGAAAGASSAHDFIRVAAVEAQPANGRTKVTPYVQPPVSTGSAAAQVSESAPAAAPAPAPQTLLNRIGQLQEALLQPPSVPPRSAQQLVRTPIIALQPNLDLAPQLFGALYPKAAASVYAALAAVPFSVPPTAQIEVYAFRVHAAPYGHNAPSYQTSLLFQSQAGQTNALEGPEQRTRGLLTSTGDAAAVADWPLVALDTNTSLLSLDARYDRIAPESFVAVRTYDDSAVSLFMVTETRERSRSDYGLSGSTTVLTLDNPFYATGAGGATGTTGASGTTGTSNGDLSALRAIDVYAQSEQLALADVPIESDIPDKSLTSASAAAAPGSVLELDGIYDGLAAGRWAIVAGTRTDLRGVSGAELVMIAATGHTTNPAVPGDTLHTFVTLSTTLAYTYARSSVTVYGNVVRATNGETRKETIGSGDASQARQTFALKAKPLTFTSSTTQSGAKSTLAMFVNGVQWNETDDLNTLGPTDRAYLTATTDAGTTVIFGDGVHGARLPTGAENVTATYRTGIGTPGNVDPAQITLLMSRPLGVKAVINPLAASGGADSESADAIRTNVPTALLALDRLVSLSDYAAFARTFAGIGKAAAAQIGTGRAALVAITVAGQNNAAIDPDGDLVNNLGAELTLLGDPNQAFTIAPCDRMLLFVSAGVDIAPNAVWETVEPAIRAALAVTFGFAVRDFGQPAYKSEAIAAVASVDGVVDVAIDVFSGVSAALFGQPAASFTALLTVDDVVTPQPARQTSGSVAPAQFVALDPNVTDSVLLRQGTEAAQ
jgi:hypothetical protein